MDQHLITVDELRASGALDVPASWRKSLGANCDVERDLFSELIDEDDSLAEDQLPLLAIQQELDRWAQQTISLRAVYRTLELPGKNPLKDAHAALDAAVLKAYGFSPKKDLLKQLLDLNLEVAARIEAGENVTAPGTPEGYPKPKSLITNDCTRPALLSPRWGCSFLFTMLQGLTLPGYSLPPLRG